MKQDKNIKPFDNLLMAYITNLSQGNYIMESSSKEAEIVFTKNYQDILPEEKVSTLLSSLEQSLSKDTLGSLVQKALSVSKTSTDDVHIATGLTSSLLEDIKADMVFTNSVPVRSLVKLLKLLNVTLEKAQTAIDATFEKLSVESKMFLTLPVKAQPSFRKAASNNTSGINLMF